MEASAGSLRMRNGSSHHSAYISGSVTRPARTTDQRKFGKIVNRNATVSRSIIIRSMKLTVICTTSCFRRDSSTSTTTMVSDNAPDSAGRRSSAIQKKLRMPQASTKASRAPKSVSVSYISASAARWGAATASSRQMPSAATLASTAVVAEGPGLGAGGIDDTLNFSPAGDAKRLAFEKSRRRPTQPEACTVSQNCNGTVKDKQRAQRSDLCLLLVSGEAPHGQLYLLTLRAGRRARVWQSRR
ncbi:hypothetical protein ACVWW5_002560 [Bradyrhizobium sp. LM3.4]